MLLAIDDEPARYAHVPDCRVVPALEGPPPEGTTAILLDYDLDPSGTPNGLDIARDHLLTAGLPIVITSCNWRGSSLIEGLLDEAGVAYLRAPCHREGWWQRASGWLASLAREPAR